MQSFLFRIIGKKKNEIGKLMKKLKFIVKPRKGLNVKAQNENDQCDIIDDIIERYNKFQIIPIV